MQEGALDIFLKQNLEKKIKVEEIYIKTIFIIPRIPQRSATIFENTSFR
jgi:hypothetical protein